MKMNIEQIDDTPGGNLSRSNRNELLLNLLHHLLRKPQRFDHLAPMPLRAIFAEGWLALDVVFHRRFPVGPGRGGARLCLQHRSSRKGIRLAFVDIGRIQNQAVQRWIRLLRLLKHVCQLMRHQPSSA